MDAPTDAGFWGEFEHGVDDKGRVVMPLEFRAGLGSEFVVTRGPDRAIFVFPTAIWQQIEAPLRNAVLNRRAQFLQRMLGGRTYVRLDPQFRLAIPKHLRDWAGITSSQSAVLVGQGKKIEVWSKTNWDAYSAVFTSDNLYDAAEELGVADVIG